MVPEFTREMVDAEKKMIDYYIEMLDDNDEIFVWQLYTILKRHIEKKQIKVREDA